MQISFLKEFCKDYYSIPAQFLCGYNPKIYSIKYSPEPSDVIGVTIFNTDSLPSIFTIRKKYPNNKIIAGGIGTLFLYRYLLKTKLVDFVYFGEGYNFDEKHIIDETMIGRSVEINREVPYSQLPIVKTEQKIYYLHAETGCPYKCEFCVVSHANKYSHIDNDDFVSKIKYLDKNLKAKQITILSNEGIVKGCNFDRIKNCRNNDYTSQSTTLKYFLNNKQCFKNQNIVRFGIELPTEDDRLAHLPKQKQITDAEIEESVSYLQRGNQIIQLFFIWNYYNIPIENYRNIAKYMKMERKALMRVAFTTHNISAYTPQQPFVINHIHQLLTTPEFSEEVKYLSCITKTNIYPPKKNVNILPDYLKIFGNCSEKYRLPKTGENVNDYYDHILKQNPNIENEINYFANNMKIENDVILTR